MKSLSISAIAILGAFGGTASASAYSFSPPDTKFHLSGQITITAPQGTGTCNMNGPGKTGGSPKFKASIQKALFGGQAPPCAIGATSYPWPLTATGAKTATISNFGFNPVIVGSDFGPCGPGTLHVKINKRGVWTLTGTLPGGCTISATIPTDPPVTIVP